MKGNDNLKKHLKRTEGISSRRIFITALTAAAVLILGAVLVLGVCLKEQALTTDFTRKNIAPCIQYPFGTDWMGRDMFVRTLTGLSLSIRIGLITSVFSSVIAVGLGLACAAGGKWADSLISGLIDVVMGIPHILLLLLISFALGKGLKGVAVGIILTHWTSLTRLIRGEVLQLRESHFIKIAEKMGMSPWRIGIRHMMPHLLPQVLVGMVLMFPHAILHEASITFLGFGLSPEQPAIGVILSESMKYLTMGKWWLALFPGLLLVLVVIMFHVIGDTLNSLLDPSRAHE